MAKAKERPQVTTTWEPFVEMVFVSDRYAVPEAFKVTADLPGGVHVELEVKVERGRARTRQVLVSSASRSGVTAVTMRDVPIRDLVGTGALTALFGSRVAKDGTRTLQQVGTKDAKDSEEIRRVVQALVGYVEVKP